MLQLQNQLRHVVNVFIAQIAHLARREASESLQRAVFVLPGGAERAIVHSARRTRDAGRQKKRTPEELAALSAEFVAYVRKHPGLRIEQINKGLGSTTEALALPIRKLVADGSVRTKGRKRSTTYFLGK